MNFELYKEYSDSPVILEDDSHIYVNKTSGKFYNSVTGCLHLVENEFNQEETIKGLINQYTGFFSWLNTLVIYPTNEQILRALTLYVNYKNYRIILEQRINSKGEVYDYRKKLIEYLSIEDLIIELEICELEHKEKIKNNPFDKFKNIYLNNDFSIMKRNQILELWKDMTDIANHYGNIVHITMEQYLMEYQNFLPLKQIELNKEALYHFNQVKYLLSVFYKKYKYTKHSFEEYEINTDFESFRKHLIFEFEKIEYDKGRVIVPEKMLLYKDILAGMTDMYFDYCPKTFGVGDHKTNKILSIVNKYGVNFKYPFENETQSELNIYTKQLKIYQLFLERIHNKTCREMFITQYSRRTHKFKRIEIPVGTTDAEKIIEIYINWINANKEKYLSHPIMGNIIKNNINPLHMDVFIKRLYHKAKYDKENTTFKSKEQAKQIYYNFVMEQKGKFEEVIKKIRA